MDPLPVSAFRISLLYYLIYIFNFVGREGKARVTLFASQGNAQTFDFYVRQL